MALDPEFLDPHADIHMSHNRLPHWQQDDCTYFVTFHLADSLPAAVLSEWRASKTQWLDAHPKPWTQVEEAEYHQRFSGARERWLDAGHGSCPMKLPAARAKVAAAILREDPAVRFWSVVLMPNHAHALVTIAGSPGVSKTVQGWKGRSGLAANQVLHTRGAFWAKDYFDRLIRDEAHFWNCARYIRRNPEKARLGADAFMLVESGYVRVVLDGV